jgi:hypothetical protein
MRLYRAEILLERKGKIYSMTNKKSGRFSGVSFALAVVQKKTTRSMVRFCLPLFLALLFAPACLPVADPYPYRPANDITAEAEWLSERLEAYIYKWTQGLAPAQIPDSLIPQGISDSKHFYLKHPDSVSAEETWAVRYAKPINKDSLYAGIPDPKITYLYLGTALAPFGSKMVLEGEFPHARFFSCQITPPLNGKEYYAQRQFGTAEVSVVDADINPLPGHTNPFRVGANRLATDRKYRLEFDLKIGDPVSLNDSAHLFPYRNNLSNRRNGALWAYQGPLGYKTVAGTPLSVQGDWDLGAFWIRIYEPDNGTGPLGGVAMPKVYFQLPTGEKYFIGSDFSKLKQRADKTIANRVVDKPQVPFFGPDAGWFKSWGISRSMLSGVCQVNNWSRIDSGARVRTIDLAWTGRGEFQPAPGNIEPHATTNNYISYLGRNMTVAPGMVAVLTGKMPTFPSTRNGEPVMQAAQMRYWSICGIDDDALSPMPATTIHAVSDDDVLLDNQRNYVIAYSRPADRPANATAANGVTWVDWGTQSNMGILMRYLNISPEWTFPLAPQENHLDFSHSDWSATLYDSSLLGLNWRHGFMRCFIPKVHYMSRAEFEALGDQTRAETIPAWVETNFKTTINDARLGVLSAGSVLDGSPQNAPLNANDGNLQTAWSSAFGQNQAYLQADLGSVKYLSAVKLLWDFIFFAKKYQILVSQDGVNWNAVVSVTDGDGQSDVFKNWQGIQARYMRLNLETTNVAYYRLLEMEVFSGDCDCTVPGNTTAVVAPSPKNALFLQIYPNPAQDWVQWAFTAPDSRETQMRVFDQQGRLLKQWTATQNTGDIDFSGWPSGVYLVQVQSGAAISTKKLVLQ